MDTFLDFPDVSSNFTFQLSARKRDYTISFELKCYKLIDPIFKLSQSSTMEIKN